MIGNKAPVNSTVRVGMEIVKIIPEVYKTWKIADVIGKGKNFKMKIHDPSVRNVRVKNNGVLGLKKNREFSRRTAVNYHNERIGMQVEDREMANLTNLLVRAKGEILKMKLMN